MKQKQLLTLSLFFLATTLILLPVANATVNGIWTTCNSSTYEVTDGDTTTTGPITNTADFNLGTITDFSGWNTTFVVNSFDKAALPSWTYENALHFFYSLKFKGANGQEIYANGQFREFSTWFGIGSNTYREVHNSFAPSNFTTETTGVWYDSVDNFNIYLSKNGTVLTYTNIDSVGTQFSSNQIFFHDNRTIDLPAAWYTSVSVTLYVGWNGEGSFSITSGSKNYTGGAVPDIPDQHSYDDEAAEQVGGLLGFLMGAVDMIVKVGQFFAGLAMGLVPLLPVIFFGYLIDMVMTSINESSFTPLGNGFRRIFTLIIEFFTMVSEAVQAILPF